MTLGRLGFVVAAIWLATDRDLAGDAPIDPTRAVLGCALESR